MPREFFMPFLASFWLSVALIEALRVLGEALS
jgi:hypothetical protein